VRAYLEDEPGHEELRTLLLEGSEPVVTSELARVELASAVQGAVRAHRLPDGHRLHDRIDADTSEHGRIFVAAFRPRAIVPYAQELVRQHRLRTLDAIHLAVALEDAPTYAGSDGVVLVTRDVDQAAAARSLGLVVR